MKILNFWIRKNCKEIYLNNFRKQIIIKVYDFKDINEFVSKILLTNISIFIEKAINKKLLLYSQK